ncbi:MAG: NosD domain-containing protein [Candidatus Thorarchaeota archaeon]
MNQGSSYYLIVSVWLLLFAGTVSFAPSTNQELMRDIDQPSTTSMFYDPSGPIVVTNDSGFIAAGFSGSGTESAPYIVEGLDITSDSVCINITGTRSHFEIRNCIFGSVDNNQTIGIAISNVTNAVVIDCLISNKEVGIGLWRTNNSIATHNILTGCRSGIELAVVNSCVASFNTAFENRVGITAYWCRDTSITNNTIHSNRITGCTLGGYGYGSVLANNTIYNHRPRFGDPAVEIGMSANWTIEYNHIYDNSVAIGDMIVSENCTIRYNRLYNNNIGLSGVWTAGCIFEFNDVKDGYSGVSLYNPERCSFSNNVFGNLTFRGISLTNGIDCRITKNQFENCGLVLEGINKSNHIHEVLDNTVNQKELGYFYNQSDTTLDGTVYGQIILVECEGMQIAGGDFHNSSRGISMMYCQDISLVDATIHHEPLGGIWIMFSEGCSIARCESYNNSYRNYPWGGILLWNSNSTHISGNRIYGNSGGGIVVAFGVSIYDCIIINNAIYDNYGYGIFLADGSDNVIYGNALGWNMNGNAFDNGVNNTWDSEELRIGNWWHDYDSSEGNNYTIPGLAGSVDRYPQTLTDRIPTPPLDPEPVDVVLIAAIGVTIAGVVMVAVFFYRRQIIVVD